MSLIQYLDSGVFSLRNKKGIKGLIGMKGDSILTKRISKEVLNEGKWIMKNASLEDRASYSEIFSKEGEIIHPRLITQDYIENKRYSKAAAKYMGLLKHRRKVLKDIIQVLEKCNYKNIPKIKQDLRNSVGEETYNLYKKGLETEKISDEEMVVNCLFDACTSGNVFGLFTEDRDVLNQATILGKQIMADKIAYELTNILEKNMVDKRRSKLIKLSSIYEKSPVEYGKINKKLAFDLYVRDEDHEEACHKSRIYNELLVFYKEPYKGQYKIHNIKLPMQCDDLFQHMSETGATARLCGGYIDTFGEDCRGRYIRWSPSIRNWCSERLTNIAFGDPFNEKNPNLKSLVKVMKKVARTSLKGISFSGHGIGFL